jgi:Flp pilus assembly protein TadD
MTEFSAAIEQEPKQALVLEAMGIICFRNGLYDEAEGNLANAVSLEPGLVRSHAHLGAIHNYRGDYGKAAASFKQAIAANPRDGSMYNNLGLALSKLDKGAEAVEAFRTALALGAPVDRTCNNLGLTLFRMGKVHEALEAFKCSGDEAAAYNNLGYAHFIAEEYHDAVACFERAIELRPSFYVRADENLKRARLALEFDKNSDPDSPAGKPEPVSTPERPVSGIEPMSATEAPSGSDSGVEIRPAMLVEEDIVESASSGFPSAPDARVRHAVASGRDRAEISRTMLKVSPGSFPRLSVKQPERPIFAVHLSSWRTLDKASEQVRLLGESGLKARVVEADLDDKGVWYRVVHGSYRGFDEALEAMEAVTAKTGRRELRVVKVTASAFGLKE